MSSVNTSLEQRDYNVIVQYNVQLTNNLVDVGLELIQHSVDDDHEVTILPTSMTSGILAGSEELPAGVFTSDTSLVLAAMSDAARGTSHFSCLAAIPHRGNNPRLICVYFDSQVTNTYLEQARRLARTMHTVWMDSDEDNAELDDGFAFEVASVPALPENSAEGGLYALCNAHWIVENVHHLQLIQASLRGEEIVPSVGVPVMRGMIESVYRAKYGINLRHSALSWNATASSVAASSPKKPAEMMSVVAAKAAAEQRMLKPKPKSLWGDTGLWKKRMSDAKEAENMNMRKKMKDDDDDDGDERDKSEHESRAKK